MKILALAKKAVAVAFCAGVCATAAAAARPGTEEMSISGLRLEESMSRYGECGTPQAAAEGPCWRRMESGSARYDQIMFQWPTRPEEAARVVTAVVMRGRIDSLLLAVPADTPQSLERARNDALRAAGRKWSGWRGPVIDHGHQAWFGPGAIGEIIESPNAVAVMLSTPEARQMLLGR